MLENTEIKQMNKKLNKALTFLLSFIPLALYAQNADQRINELLGSEDWFALNREYSEVTLSRTTPSVSEHQQRTAEHQTGHRLHHGRLVVFMVLRPQGFHIKS